jgi:hypothetical protein
LDYVLVSVEPVLRAPAVLASSETLVAARLDKVEPMALVAPGLLESLPMVLEAVPGIPEVKRV